MKRKEPDCGGLAFKGEMSIEIKHKKKVGLGHSRSTEGACTRRSSIGRKGKGKETHQAWKRKSTWPENKDLA